MKQKKKLKGNTLFDYVNYIALFVFAIVMIYPFYYVLVLSFSDGAEVVKGNVYFWPKGFTGANYMAAFNNQYIFSSFKISIFRTVLGTLLSVALTSMVAYALTLKDLPGKSIILKYFFITTIFSGGIIPYYLLLNDLRLIDNIWLYLLTGLYNFFNIVVIRTFYQSLPESLSEAAIIDGCTSAQVYYKMYLPLSKPVLATTALFCAVGHWNDWFTGAFYMNSQARIPAATLLQQIIKQTDMERELIRQGNSAAAGYASMMQSGQITPETIKMAFIIIMVLPILCVYPFLQKYFVKGVMVGSIKG